MKKGQVMDYAAQNLERLRKAQGLSRRELAEAVNEKGGTMYTTTVTRLETGQSQMKLADAILLAEVLGVTLERFAKSPVEDSDHAKVIRLRNECQKAEVKAFREVRAYLGSYRDLRGALRHSDLSQVLKDADVVSRVEIQAAQDWLGMVTRREWYEHLERAESGYDEYLEWAADAQG